MGARGVLGARAARVVLAVSASSLLTAVVAVPLAYQAHAARESHDERPAPTTTTVPPPSVLGTSTVPTSFTTSSTSTTAATTTTVAGGATSSPTTTAASQGRGGTTDSGGGATTTTAPWFVAPAPPTTATPDVPTTVPPTTPTTPPTTTPAVNAAGLYVSISMFLDAPEPLEGATLQTASFVFLDLPGVTKVEFFLDGELTATEFQSPWELFGGLPLVPRTLDGEEHTVRAEITFADGHVETRQASFRTALPG